METAIANEYFHRKHIWKLEAINNCRMYICIFYISKMMNDMGCVEHKYLDGTERSNLHPSMNVVHAQIENDNIPPSNSDNLESSKGGAAGTDSDCAFLPKLRPPQDFGNYFNGGINTNSIKEVKFLLFSYRS